MVTARTRAGDAIVKDLFGGSLYEQGRGYYVALELLSVIWGTRRAGHGVLPSPVDLPSLEYSRRSHDFARRLMRGRPEDVSSEERAHYGDDPGSRETLQALLEGLRVPIPFRRKLPMWGGQHLYPYIGELIHYDAVTRRGRPAMERYTYRGAGLLAHEILRTDDDPVRLDSSRSGLERLVEDSESSLGRLMNALSEHDSAPQQYEIWSDELAQETNVDESRRTAWFEALRSGTSHIVSRDSVRAKQIEQLMHWVPYCIARHELELALRSQNSASRPVPVDCASGGQIRRMSRRTLDRDRASITEALKRRAEELASGSEDADTRRIHHQLLEGSQNWRKGPASFFTATLATVGALNHVSGRRHYTLSLPLLEAVVAAALEPNERIEFETFCFEVLYKRFGLVVDQRSASFCGLTHEIDAADFELNEQSLAGDLQALGMMTEYSDATRLVHAEVL